MTSSLPTSLGGLRRLFAQATPSTELPTGDHHITFVGPSPLRVVAPRAIALGGMPGWRGKRFAADGTAVNLIDDDEAGRPREVLPMRVSLEDSWLDGRPTIVCSYGADSPKPWRWVRDEFRALDDRRLLGLTFVGGPWSRIAAAPLLLTRA